MDMMRRQYKEPDTRFEALFQAIPGATFIVDQQGSIKRASRSASRLFGFPPEELEGMKLTELFSGFEDAAWTQIREGLRRDPSSVIDAYALLKGGAPLRTESRVVTLDAMLCEIAVFTRLKGNQGVEGQPRSMREE